MSVDDDTLPEIEKAIGRVVTGILLNEPFRKELVAAEEAGVLFEPTDESQYQPWIMIVKKDRNLAKKLQEVASKVGNWKVKDIGDKLNDLIPEHTSIFWDTIRTWGRILKKSDLE